MGRAATLLFLLVSACSNRGDAEASQPMNKPTEESQESELIESPSMQFLPRQEEVPGWRLEADPIVLTPKKLTAELDQEATHFLRYEVLDLTIGNYTRTTASGFARVEIFRFPDFVKAFGAYSTQRKAVVNFLDIGNESFLGPHSIHVWRGPFYVRITGPAPLADALKELTSAVAEGMPAASGKPAVFSFFPDKFRVVNSEVFSADAAFGQPILTHGFLATFNVEGEQIEGYIMPATSKTEVTKVFQAYKQFFVSNGRLLDPVPNLGEDNFTGEDRYLGRTVAFRLDRFLIIFRGYRDKQKLIDLAALTDQRILGTIRKQLVTADKKRDQPVKEDENQPPWKVPLPPTR